MLNIADDFLAEDEISDSCSLQLTFSKFDISKVLIHGASLLASEGAQYDVQDEMFSKFKH